MLATRYRSIDIYLIPVPCSSRVRIVKRRKQKRKKSDNARRVGSGYREFAGVSQGRRATPSRIGFPPSPLYLDIPTPTPNATFSYLHPYGYSHISPRGRNVRLRGGGGRFFVLPRRNRGKSSIRDIPSSSYPSLASFPPDPGDMKTINLFTT